MRHLFSLALALAVGLSAPRGRGQGALPSPLAGVPASRGWLGVALEDGTPQSPGAVVRHVVRGSPAAKAGLREGDRIQLMNGETILASRMLTQRVASHSPGEMVSLGIVRGGKNTDIRVALGVRPTGDELMRMDHVGTFAPAWSFTQSVGSAPSSLDSLRGRVVVLDFWATWCGPCRMMSPRLSALNARYGAQGLSVVGMTTDGPDEVAAFAQRHEMHYDLVLDTRGDTSRAYGVTGLPTVFVIDKRGVIREVSVGFDPSDDGLERIVRTLIAEKESLPGDPPDKPLQLPSKSPGPGRD